MNAINFIKQHGVDKAREVVSKHAECYMPEVFKYWSEQLQDYVLAPKYASFLVSDLKRLVESVDLIKKHGGLFSTKCQLDKGGSDYEWYGENGDYGLTDLGDLEQAIADYESIYSGEEH